MHYFKKVLKIKDIFDVHHNIGVCYENMRDYESAETTFFNCYQTYKSYNYKLLYSLANVYYINKQYSKSIEFYKKITDYEKKIKIKYFSSFNYLAQKKFKIGFELYENRTYFNDVNPQTNLCDRLDIPSINFWNGKDKCKKLLIVAEQGLGDNIQYYRFIVELSELYPNMIIHFFCKKEIAHLFKKYNNIEIVDNLILHLINVYNYDYKIYIMSLPYILKLTKIQPNKINYINKDENKYAYWKEKLSSFKRKKVGIVYNGLLSSFIEKNIPLIDFKVLCDLDIDLICIHRKNDIQEEFSKLPSSMIDKIHYFDIDNDKPFVDTIHILQNIDLLITIDTFIVHLAGIMNVKTWLLLGRYSEWRWANDDSTTYWYNSVELIRMREKKELRFILETLTSKLKTFCITNN